MLSNALTAPQKSDREKPDTKPIMFVRMLRVARALHPGADPRSLRQAMGLFARQLIWHRRLTTWYDGKHPALLEAVVRRPAIVSVIQRPYISTGWSASRRLRAVEEHHRSSAGCTGVLRVAARAPVVLATISAREASLEVVLDSPMWFRHEGESTINVFCAGQRLYTIAFSLGIDNGATVAYVGALQGYGGEDALDTYRHLTHGLHGLRPRDLVITALRTLVEELGVQRILAVGDSHRVSDSPYFRGTTTARTSYDSAWMEHHGVARDDGFFELPLAIPRRSHESIPTQKRSAYRKRYEMLDRLEADMLRSIRAHAEA